MPRCRGLAPCQGVLKRLVVPCARSSPRSFKATAAPFGDVRVEQLRHRQPQPARSVGTRAATTDPAAEPLGSKQRPPQVAVLSYKEQPEILRAAVENIAAAFHDDPSTTYFCRPNQRVQFYRSVLSCLLDWYPEERQMVCTLPPHAAAVVYVYPRLRELGSWSQLLRGGLAPLACVRLERLLAGMDASEFFEQMREDFLKAHGPFLYLSVMAVRPDQQGRGLGSALLGFICDRADAAGLHCYVEATSLRNRVLYERFGFQLIQSWRANPEMPYTYVMSRQPRPVGSAAAPAAALPTAGEAPADLEAPAMAASGAEAGGADSGSGTAAPAAVPWWQQGGQPRRQRFAMWRRQRQAARRLARQDDANYGTYRFSETQASVQYIDLDEYGWWPLMAREAGYDTVVDAAAAASTPAAEAACVPGGDSGGSPGSGWHSWGDSSTSSINAGSGSSGWHSWGDSSTSSISTGSGSSGWHGWGDSGGGYGDGGGGADD